MKFLEMFKPIEKGDFGLTDEAIYKSIQMPGTFVPIWGGNKEHDQIDRLVSENGRTKQDKKITVFNGDGIILSLDGSAGCMTHKIHQNFALNHHAGFFMLRDDAGDKVIPEFFALFFQQQFREAAVSEGSMTLTLDTIYLLDFELPSIGAQRNIMAKIKPLIQKRGLIEKKLMRITELKEKSITIDYKKFQVRDAPISKLIAYLSGNTGLTERTIYQNSGLEGKRFVVLSGSTLTSTQMGEVPACKIVERPISTFENREGLLVIRKGKAGETRYLPRGNYTINDDAYILYIKEDCPYNIRLKWLSIQYRQEFLAYASSSDNGTWNMTGFFENTKIDVPAIDEQLAVEKAYMKLETLETKLRQIDTQIDQIFTKVISENT